MPQPTPETCMPPIDLRSNWLTVKQAGLWSVITACTARRISPTMLSVSDAENSARSARIVGRPFERGRSGNPGGRPRAALDVQALAREHTPAAVRTLVEALRDPRLKVAAAQALLDRGWGKPLQTIHAQNDATVLHLVAARELGDDLLRKLKTPIVDGDAVDHETQQIVDPATLPPPEE